MPGKRINLTGTNGETYDLDQMKNEGRRSLTTDLIVEIWEWNPKLPKPHNHPNPENPEIGRIWLSKFVEEGSADFNALLK